MKRNLTLPISSFVCLVLFTFHLTDDTLHAREGMDATGTAIVIGIMLVMLYGTVELAERRFGYAIMLVGGAATMYMPFLHGMGPNATKWGYLFVWTMVAMGAAGSFTMVLAARELWRAFRKNVGALAASPSHEVSGR